MFGKNAFRISKHGEKRSPINKGLFDAWGAVLPNIEETKFKKLLDVRDMFIDKYDELKNEVHFYETVSRTAWKKNNVEYRFSKIRELIEEFAV
ncbi:hypothetical protein [Treponema pedis]|uniref:Uncharacterized protein n=1 Tax=Treponema pedis TaxID=409322 RepID=A0A7S7AXE1_9SPIR|nr:hypothetical protein [Treponema pedis]QOW61699.1 hypothetical protein IFE08_04825 [Treponema pedis]